MAKIRHEILDQRLQCHASNATDAKYQMNIDLKTRILYTPHDSRLILGISITPPILPPISPPLLP